MENSFKILSKINPLISVQVVKGHFATSSAHRSHYIDIFDIKSSSSVAKHTAKVLAAPYTYKTAVDVIVHMDGTEVLAAYMADELLQAGLGVINEGNEIYIVTPMIRADGRFVFHQSVQEKIRNKDVLLLMASVSTGATVSRVMECFDYYGCNPVGISAVYTAVPSVNGKVINSLFTNYDIPDYRLYPPSECLMCKEGLKLDAVFNCEGFTKL